MNPLLEQTTDEHKKRPKKGENKIYMEFVPGPSVAEFLRTKTSDNDTVEPQEDIDTVARQLGQILCSMHALNIAHGDLTTSNMLLRNGRPETLVLIDFGLSSVSSSAEDKAVDLYVLERAIASTHPHLSTRTPSWVSASFPSRYML